MTKEKTRRWHYTTMKHLREILISEVIQLSNPLLRGVKPASWVSSNPHWEVIANKMYARPTGEIVKHISTEEMFNIVGVARIEVVPTDSYITWKKYRHVSGISQWDFLTMEQVGIDRGANPSEWYARFSPIPKEEWLTTQIRIDGKWIDLTVPRKVRSFSAMKGNVNVRS